MLTRTSRSNRRIISSPDAVTPKVHALIWSIFFASLFELATSARWKGVYSESQVTDDETPIQTY